MAGRGCTLLCGAQLMDSIGGAQQSNSTGHAEANEGPKTQEMRHAAPVKARYDDETLPCFVVVGVLRRRPNEGSREAHEFTGNVDVNVQPNHVHYVY
jgi:hypothetical protein